MPRLTLILPRFAPNGLPARWQRLADRGNRLAEGERGFAAALAEQFEWPGQGFPAAAWLRQHAKGDAGDSVWLLVEPAWVQADVSGARLMACGRLGLAAAESAALARAVAPLFGDAGYLLEPLAADRWLLQMPAGASVPAWEPPERAMGDDLLAHLPPGAAGRKWRVLFNEAQVALHQHPINRQRQEQGLPPANSLWFWGGGRLPGWTRSPLQCVYSDDPLARAMAAAAGVAQQPTAAAADNSWAESHLLLDLADDKPAATALASLIPPRRASLLFAWLDGRRVETRPGHRWRLWRRQSD